MSRTQKIKILALFVFGIIFVFKNYIIVIGQTPRPVPASIKRTTPPR